MHNSDRLIEEILLNLEKKSQELSLKIDEELNKARKSDEFKEIETSMQDIINNSMKNQDDALKNFLHYKGPINFDSYKKYCDLYLKGDFESFPFASDHHKIEQRERKVWVHGYLDFDAPHYINEHSYPRHGHFDTEYYDERVFDYREYFKVDKSIDKKIANEYIELYNKRKKFISEHTNYDSLLLNRNKFNNEISRIKDKYDTCLEVALITLTGIVSILAITMFTIAMYEKFEKNIDAIKENFNTNKLMTIAVVSMSFITTIATGLLLAFVYKKYKDRPDSIKKRFDTSFLVDRVENTQNMEKINDALNSA